MRSVQKLAMNTQTANIFGAVGLSAVFLSSAQLNSELLPSFGAGDYAGCEKANRANLPEPTNRIITNAASHRYANEIHVKYETAGEALKAEFDLLVNKWKEETFFYSSLTKQFSHPAYTRIIAMGKPALPLVLKELQNSNDNWFYALKFMAGEDVSAGIKTYEEAKSAWLEWGYRHNYI